MIRRVSSISYREFLAESLSSNPDIYMYSYKGIVKKDYPKWEGWKIIAEHKASNKDIKSIKDERLDVLVKNFYYLKFLEEQTDQSDQ